MFFLRIVFLLFLQISFFSIFGQDIQEKFDKVEAYHASNPQEKIYLHLDKYAYSAGESIWFKAYTTIGIENLLSNWSGIAYVELIDASSKVTNKMTIPLLMGIGVGDIKLSDTITEGSYRLRAYTNWMRNTDKQFFYDRTIQITNGRSDNVITNTSVSAVGNDNVYSINLKSLSGVALSKSNVRYEILNDGKSVERKRVTTDEDGNLNIKVSKKHVNTYLNLIFENGEKQSVKKIIKMINPESDYHIDLLPEGGKLVSGRLNNISIKAIDKKGLGVKLECFLIIGNDTAASVKTNDLGMGASTVFLAKGDSLNVIAKVPEGINLSINTPKIHDSGFSIIVNNLNESKVYAQLNLSSDLISDQLVYFVVHHLGRPLFISKQKRNKEELVFSVDRKSLPAGLITISLLDDKFLPIIERPFFNFNKQHLLQSSVTLDKEQYSKKEKVMVNLVIGDEADSLKIGAFSASVVDVSKIKDNPNLAPNILTTLLLQSDLKGYVQNPGYYFENNVIKVQELDQLLITQGWRNIDWQASEVNILPKYEVEKTLKISGYAKKLGRSKPEPNAKMQLISTKNFMDYIDTVATEDGYFVFDNLVFPDSVKFLITARDANKGKKNIDIVINEREPAEIGSNPNAPDEKWDVNKEYADEIKHIKQYFAELQSKGLMDKSIQIEEVVVTAARKQKKAAENSANLNGSGNADQIINAEDLETCTSLEMCLAGRLVGVYFQAGVPYNTRGNQPMQIVLDGMYVESDMISMINIADIESIEVLRNSNYTTIYGSNGANGLIIITSKTGKASLSNVKPVGIVTVQPQGLHSNREFYKPKYDVDEALKFDRDYRTTIHWEPSLVTSKEGKTSFDFFTSDNAGKYLLIIEGLDIYGKLLRKVVEIEVK